MKKNMGNIDKGIRTSIAIIIALLYLTGVIEGTTAIVAGVIAIIFALTSMISFCPIYTLLGINSCKVKK